MRTHYECLGRKRGSSRTSPVIARGGGAMDATDQRGVVVADCEALGTFYRA
jgi:hypothetical protein